MIQCRSDFCSLWPWQTVKERKGGGPSVIVGVDVWFLNLESVRQSLTKCSLFYLSSDLWSSPDIWFPILLTLYPA